MIKDLFKRIILFFFGTSFFYDENATLLFGIKKKFKKIYSLKKYSFGKLNKNKFFFIIKRSPGAGMFSNVTFVLNFILFSKKKRFIPIVDMKNFPTIYNEKKKIYGTLNAWEYYFKPLNKYTLEEVYNSKNVYFSSSYFQKNMSLDMTINKLKNQFKLIKFKNNLKKKADIFYNKNFKKRDKVLGVHFRGSTYKVARGHAFPPTTEIMIEHINFLIKKYNYNKIFLVTEEANYLKKIKDQFRDNCHYLSSFRMKNLDSFKIYPRQNHRHKLGEETIVETLILSKCDGLTYIKSNVISAAICLSQKKQKYHEMFLGYNFRNKFIARWLWFLKKILPKGLGGLRLIEKEKFNT